MNGIFLIALGAIWKEVAFGQDDDITVLTLTCIGPGDRAFGELAEPAHGIA
jgi:hypothetical protein